MTRVSSIGFGRGGEEVTSLSLIMLASSTDAQTNRWASHGPGYHDVSALAVDPADANRLFFAAAGGVYKSIDGGLTWTPRALGYRRTY